MQVGVVVVLFTFAILASVAREVYGNKGIFVLPKITEKSLALGSLYAVVCAVFAVCFNLGTIADEISIKVAVSLGVAWGIAAPDIVSNVIARFKEQ